MKQPTKQDSCDYLLKEISLAKDSIEELLERISQLERLSQLLTCPDDTSPEAIERNKKALEQVTKELQ